MNVAATGWFTVGLAPIRKITSALATSRTWLETAPELMPSISAATLEAWHSRVQWSTLLRPEPGAHQLLEEIRLFVRALRGSKAGERTLAVGVADLQQPLGRKVHRFFPRGLAEHLVPVLRIDGEVLVLRHARLADERLGQAVLVLHVVEAVAALHAQAAGVGRAVAALDVEDLVVPDVVGQLAADAAVRAHRIDGLLGHHHRRVAGRHQGARWGRPARTRRRRRRWSRPSGRRGRTRSSSGRRGRRSR